MADKEQDYKPSLAQRWKKFNQADDSGMTLKEETRRAAMRGLLWYHDGVSFMPFAVITMATGLSLILPVAHHNNYEPQALLEQSDMDISLTQGYDTTFGYRAVELPDGQTIMVVRDENDVWRVYQERPFDSKVDEAWSQGAEELTYIEDSAEAYAAIKRAQNAINAKIEAFDNHIEGEEARTQLLDFGEISKPYEFKGETIRTTDMPFSAVPTGHSFYEEYRAVSAEFAQANAAILLHDNYGFKEDSTPVELTDRPDHHFFSILGFVLGGSAAVGIGMGAFGTTVNTASTVMRRRKRQKSKNLDNN